MSEKNNKQADETKKMYSSNQASQYVKNLMNTKTPQPISTPVNEQPDIETKDDVNIEDNKSLQIEADKSNAQPTRQKKRQSVNQSAYKDIFLIEGNLKERQSVYISKKIHLKLSNYLSVIAGKGFSIGVFIDNILNEHLSNYKKELDELYRTETDKLLNQ